MPTFQVNPKYAVLTELTEGLFICGVSSLKREILENVGIDCIINCTKEVPNLCVFDGERLKLWLDDTEETDIMSYFDMVVDKIHDLITEGCRVLVHCVAGVSRSAAFALAYLVKYERMTLRKAYTFCAAKRPLVRPNLGFWKQLIDYEKLIRGCSTVAIVPYELYDELTETHQTQLIPDVYLDEIGRQKENSPNNDNTNATAAALCQRRRSSSSKFIPKLETVPEMEMEP